MNLNTLPLIKRLLLYIALFALLAPGFANNTQCEWDLAQAGQTRVMSGRKAVVVGGTGATGKHYVGNSQAGSPCLVLSYLFNFWCKHDGAAC